MKSIVRRDTGEDWNEYVKRLMREAGEIEEDDEPTLLTSIFAPPSPNFTTSPRPPRIGRKALLERINQLKPTSSTGC